MWLDKCIWNPGMPMLCHRCHDLLLVCRCFAIASISYISIISFRWQLELHTGVCSWTGWAWPFCKGRRFWIFIFIFFCVDEWCYVCCALQLCCKTSRLTSQFFVAEPGHFEKANATVEIRLLALGRSYIFFVIHQSACYHLIIGHIGYDQLNVELHTHRRNLQDILLSLACERQMYCSGNLRRPSAIRIAGSLGHRCRNLWAHPES
jgi:hypothetical protein